MKSGGRKSGDLVVVLMMGAGLAAAHLSAGQTSTSSSTTTTPAQHSTATTHQTTARPTAKTAATHTTTSHTTARHTAATHTQTTAHATTKSGTAHSTRTAAAAKKPATHATSASAARRPAGTQRTTASSKRTVTAASTRKARRRRARPLTEAQRLARLHLEPDRVREIQQALAREGYFDGEPTGQWDANTRAAMLRYQTDHGFPATGLPEAKSLMKLGLGSHPLPPELDPSLAHATPSDASTPNAGAPDAAKTDPCTEPAAPHTSPEPAPQHE